MMSCRTYKNACNQPMVTSREHVIYFANKRRGNESDPTTIITIDVGGGIVASGSAVITTDQINIYNEVGSGGIGLAGNAIVPSVFDETTSGGISSGGAAIEEYRLAEFFGGDNPGGTTSVAVDDTILGNFNAPADPYNVHDNDTNQGSEDLVAYLVVFPNFAQEFHLYRDGSVYYEPIPDLNGFPADSFQYQNFDGTGWTNVATVNVDIPPV